MPFRGEAGNSDMRVMFDDVFFVLEFVSEELYQEVLSYLLDDDEVLPLPRPLSSELAVMPELLTLSGPHYRESALKHALEILRPDWSVYTHWDARARLQGHLALMDEEGDRIILRYSRILATLTPTAQQDPLVPRSIASLIVHSLATSSAPRSVPTPAISTRRYLRLLEAEGFSSRESRSAMIELLLNSQHLLAKRLAGRVRDMPDAPDFLLESRAEVTAFLDGMNPDRVDLALDMSERDTRIAALVAPFLVRAVVNGNIWQRDQVRAVLRATPIESYLHEVERWLRECTTARLARTISIVEKLEDTAFGAEILQKARDETVKSARRKLLDAAIDRMASYTFAPLAFDPPAVLQPSPIEDSPLSSEDVETLRSALANRRKRAVTYAKAREKNLDSPWHAATEKKYMEDALVVVKECDLLLQDVESLAKALEGLAPRPTLEAVVDETLLKHLSGFTVAQKLRLISEEGQFHWWKLRHQLPLPGVTAQDILDFGEKLGHHAADVGLSILGQALGGWGVTFVVEPAGMWPVAEDYPIALDSILGLTPDSDSYHFAESICAALQIIASSPKPLPQYLASVQALTRSPSKFVKEVAVAALAGYHLAS